MLRDGILSRPIEYAMLWDGILQRPTKYPILQDGELQRPTEYHQCLRKYSNGRQSTSAICAHIMTADKVHNAIEWSTTTADRVRDTTGWNTTTAVGILATMEEVL